MKASDLIKKLEHLIDEHGDLHIASYQLDYNNGIYEISPVNGIKVDIDSIDNMKYFCFD